MPRLARERPCPIRSVFGIIAAPRGTGEDWLANAHRIADRGYSTLLSPDGTGLHAPFVALTAAAAAVPGYTPEEIDRYIEAWSQPGAASGMINYYRSSVRTPPQRAEAALRPVKAPTLIIWGQQDQYLGPELERVPWIMGRGRVARS